jgi:hypothetical protein
MSRLTILSLEGVLFARLRHHMTSSQTPTRPGIPGPDFDNHRLLGMQAFQKRQQFCRSAVPAAWVPVSSPRSAAMLVLPDAKRRSVLRTALRSTNPGYLALVSWALPKGSKDRGTFLEFAGFQQAGQYDETTRLGTFVFATGRMRFMKRTRSEPCTAYRRVTQNFLDCHSYCLGESCGRSRTGSNRRCPGMVLR